jgi:hypothetical protein
MYPQDDPMVYQRWGIFDINRVKTKLNNTGLLCDGNQQSISKARPPAFEFPNGSNISYGTAVGVVIGAPKDQPPGAVGDYPPLDYSAFCDATLDEGPAAFWDEEHFAPYPEIVGLAGEGLAMSDKPNAWPVDGWPQLYPDSEIPIEIGSEGWPGFGAEGERLADQESFSVVYAWGGTDQIGAIGSTNPNWLKTQLIIRGLAWTGSLYENFIVWIYVIRNMGTEPIHDMRVAIHADFGCLPIFLPPNPWGDADRHYYDPKLELAYASDDDGYEDSPTGGSLAAEQIAWAGVVALEMPGPSNKVETYDAFHFWEKATTSAGNGARSDLYFEYNIRNVNDPHDSDQDGIDDDFDENGIPDILEGGPNYYVGSGADGVQTLGSSPFNLNPGGMDTLIFATVFGENRDDLITNAKRAITLYQSNWEIVKAPPAPVVESFPENQKVALVWGTESEKDVQFEGYKIYRSADGGKTWGNRSFKDFSGGVHYIPIVQYDLENNIIGNYQTLPEFAWFYLGSDSWVPFRTIVEEDSFIYFDLGDTVNVFIDRDVINGMNYIYYVAAYDSGNGIIGPLENTSATDPSLLNNTVSVIPHGSISINKLDNVRVVPNPYMVTSMWEKGSGRQIQFIHLPEKATIRIFNTSGELVRTLEHDSGMRIAPSVEIWDLKNYNNQIVAAGLYFYHIESGSGETDGKFVIVL